MMFASQTSGPCRGFQTLVRDLRASHSMQLSQGSKLCNGKGRDGSIAAVQGNRTAMSIPRSAARRGAVQNGIPSKVTRPRVT